MVTKIETQMQVRPEYILTGINGRFDETFIKSKLKNDLAKNLIDLVFSLSEGEYITISPVTFTSREDFDYGHVFVCGAHLYWEYAKTIHQVRLVVNNETKSFHKLVHPSLYNRLYYLFTGKFPGMQ